MKFMIPVLMFFSFNSLAPAAVQIEPKIKIDCHLSESQAVGQIRLVETQIVQNDSVAKFAITFGTCKLGETRLEKIDPSFTVYVLNSEYSRGVQYDAALSSETQANLTLKLNSQEAFAQFPTRHFEISFYSSTNSAINFAWLITATLDPASNTIQYSVGPR